MLYNAVIRQYGSSAVLGRVMVNQWEEVPSTYIIEYRGCIISRETNLGTLFINNKEPLHLVKLPLLEDGNETIFIANVCVPEGKLISFPVNGNTTVEMLREKIEKVGGIPRKDQRLEYCDERLEDEKTLKYYNVKSNPSIELRLALTGGGFGDGFLSVDIEGGQLKGHCVRVQKTWQMYDLGMNIYGKGPSRKCSSKFSRSKEVVINMKYGRLRLDVGKFNFRCSACQEGLITPSNFLVTRGRALFRYKKSGLTEKVKTVLLESLGSLDEFKTFADPTFSNKMVTYDYIEVTTVGVESSPYHCSCCNFAIDEKEVVLHCGHVLHPNCIDYSSGQKNRRVCRVCHSKWFDKIPDNDSGFSGDNDDFVDVVNHPTSAAQDEWKSEYEEMSYGVSIKLEEKKENEEMINGVSIKVEVKEEIPLQDTPFTRSKAVERNQSTNASLVPYT